MKIFLSFLFILILNFSLITSQDQESEYPCDDEIYCWGGEGSILHTVQMAYLVPDSKTFVDMKIKESRDAVNNSFVDLLEQYEDAENIPVNAIREFVSQNFEQESSHFDEWDPEKDDDGWSRTPAFLNKIRDTKFRKFGSDINEIWKKLGRKIKVDVKDNPELYSMIYVPNPVIVPGGRFVEFYYWDTYWVFQGLLLSNMKETVKRMLLNFIELMNHPSFGFIPNGGRIYFQRSQPPLFIPMIWQYWNATEDEAFIRDNLVYMKKELQWWEDNRNIDVPMKVGDEDKIFKMYRYNVELGGPRPESYREDYEHSVNMTEEDRIEFFYNMKSAAESGWDFSSRWFRFEEGDNIAPEDGELKDTKTRDIVPVDLNSMLYLATVQLAEFHKILNDENGYEEYYNKSIALKEAINTVLWDETVGCWLDYYTKTNRRHNFFYPSNIAPLWANIFKDADDEDNREHYVSKVLAYLKAAKVTVFPAGIPTSLENSGEQWDFPNGWAPLQEMFVTALENSGNPEMKQMAYEAAEKWVSTSLAVFEKDETLYEKYDVSKFGEYGGGGEYDVVEGFGWTNGVILKFLNDYGHRLGNSASSFTNIVSLITSMTIISLYLK